MKSLRTILLALAMLTLSVPVAGFAAASETVQNERFGIELERPSEWVDSGGSDRALFTFLHEPSQSRIEVIGTELITADVAGIFYEAFHEVLRASGFESTGSEDRDYNNNAGQLSSYSFNHAGVTLSVKVFQFERQDVAWLMVLYAEESQIEALEPVFGQLIASFRTRG